MATVVGARPLQSASNFSSQFLAEGNWGRVESIPFLLSPPMELISHYQHELTPQPWYFPSSTLTDVAALLHESGLDADQTRELLSRARLRAEINGVEITPPPELVSALSPSARCVLYDWLGDHDINSAQANAFRFLGTSLDDWFQKAPLADETIERVRPYVFQRGPYLVFADLAQVAQHCVIGELSRLVKVLSRELTLRLNLHVGEHDRLPEIARYWGAGQRDDEFLTLLESVTHLTGDHVIDVVHLLPPFARRVLYTYPKPRKDGLDHRRDCHWSAMNFFRDEPDDQFADLAYVARVMDSSMLCPSDGPQLGDVAVFLANDTDAIHSAVYIADDVYLTKNGPAINRPWILMRLNDLRHFYPKGRPQSIRYYRWPDMAR